MSKARWDRFHRTTEATPEKMSFSVADSQVFILRVWREPRELRGQPPAWRAALEHLPTGNRQSFGSLDGVVAYLEDAFAQLVASERADGSSGSSS